MSYSSHLQPEPYFIATSPLIHVYYKDIFALRLNKSVYSANASGEELWPHLDEAAGTIWKMIFRTCFIIQSPSTRSLRDNVTLKLATSDFLIIRSVKLKSTLRSSRILMPLLHDIGLAVKTLFVYLLCVHVSEIKRCHSIRWMVCRSLRGTLGFNVKKKKIMLLHAQTQAACARARTCTHSGNTRAIFCLSDMLSDYYPL